MIRMVLAGVLLLSFFLPWFSVSSLLGNLNISGFKLVDYLTSELALFISSIGLIFYVLYLIPIFAVVTLVKKGDKKWSRITGIVTFLLAIFVALIAKDGAGLLFFLSFGGYLTLLSSLGLIITSFMEDETATTPTAKAS